MSFARHFGQILRRGTVAAFGSAVPLILPVVVVGFVVSPGGVIDRRNQGQTTGKSVPPWKSDAHNKAAGGRGLQSQSSPNPLDR